MLVRNIILGIGLLLLGRCPAACAGWLTIKNDTKYVIVVQEVGGTIQRPIKGKSIQLQPGEIYREFQLLAGSKNVILFDSEQAKPVTVQDSMTWTKDDASYAVKTEGKNLKLIGSDTVEPMVKK